MALAGYAGTMAAALTVLVVLWNSFIGTPVGERIRSQPHPIVAVSEPARAEEAAPARQVDRWGPPVIHKASDDAVAADASAAHSAALKQAAAEKAKRLKLARGRQQRQEQLARQREQPQGFSTALGYDEERGRSADFGAPLNLFGTRRF